MKFNIVKSDFAIASDLQSEIYIKKLDAELTIKSLDWVDNNLTAKAELSIYCLYTCEMQIPLIADDGDSKHEVGLSSNYEEVEVEINDTVDCLITGIVVNHACELYLVNYDADKKTAEAYFQEV
jgi:hypothetical protein